MRADDRRGSFSDAVLALIVFIAVFMIIALVMTNILFVSKRSFSDKECQTSLMLTRAIDKPLAAACVKPIENPTPIKCSRRFLTAEADAVRDTGGKDTMFSRGDRDVTKTYLAMDRTLEAKDPQAIPKRVLAEEMRHCWSTFFEGELVVFQQVDQSWDVNNNERACFVCSEVTLTAPVTEFKTYLATTAMPLSAKGKDLEGTTYYDFLAGSPKSYCNQDRAGKLAREKDTSCWDTFGQPYDADEGFWSIGWLTSPMPAIQQDEFRPGTYAVVFLREGMETQACENPGEEDYTPTLTVQVIPADKIGTYCPVVLT